MKYTLLILTIAILLISCATSQIEGVYSRKFKTCIGAMPSITNQKLLINLDSSYILTNYKDEFNDNNSSVIYGLIKNNHSSKSYSLVETNPDNIFCVLIRKNKVFFYDCALGRKYRYSHPFARSLAGPL